MKSAWRLILCLVLPPCAVAAETPAPAAPATKTAPVATPPVDPAAARAADVILDRWITALGGVEALQSLRTLEYRAELQAGDGRRLVGVRGRTRADGRYRLDYEMADRPGYLQAFDGSIAWQRSESLGFGYLRAQENQANAFAADFRYPLQAKVRFPTRRALPPETIDGRSLDIVELQPPEGPTERWCFDPQGGQRVRVEVMGGAQRRVLLFGDFRTVEGAPVQLPFRLERILGEDREVTVYTSQRANAELPDDVFAAPDRLLDENLEINRVLQRHARFSGAAVARTILTRVLEQKVKVTTSGLQYTSKSYHKRPNYYATEQDVPGMGKVWQGFDGKIGWAWNEVEGFRRIQGAELGQLLSRADMDGPLNMAGRAPLRRWLGEKIVDGRPLVGVALAVPQGSVGELYFDKATGELARAESVVQTGADGQMRMAAEFRDYREVDGVKIPFATTLTNPAMRMEISVQSVQQNVLIDSLVFQPRRE